MALPAIKTVEDCADYAKVVEPFIPQLKELPWKVAETVSNHGSLIELYKDTNPLVSGTGFSVALGFVFLAVSEFNRNYSQVDRMWSLLPTIYNAHFAIWSHMNDLPSQRLDLVFLWSAIWSARLTFNYWRKGGYSVGSEDYRWEIIKGYVHPVIFFLFNVTFISFIQSVLLFSLAAPTYSILLSAQIEPEIQAGDWIYFGLQIALVTIEWFSDQQQWDYQKAKKEYQKTAKVTQGFAQEDLDRGFVTSGLWAYSRHPNFAAEQSIWFVLYQWACYSTKTLYNWAGAGPLALIMLFQGSTWLTELITAGKYADYADYQKQAGRFLPSLQPYRPSKQKSKQK